MLNFNLKESAIFQAVKWERHFLFRFARTFQKVFLFLFIFAFVAFFYGFFFERFSDDLNQRVLGGAVLSLTLYLSIALKESFFNSKVKKPRLRPAESGTTDGQAKLLEDAVVNSEKYNLAEFLSFEVAKAVNSSLKFAKSKKMPELNSTTLFYFLLRENPKLNFVFSRALLDMNKIIDDVKETLKAQFHQKFSSVFANDFQNSILEAFKIAQKREHERIEIGDVILALAKHAPVFQKTLINFDLKAEDIEDLTQWLENLERRNEESKKFWEYKNLARRGTFAKEWAAGYTVLLDQFSIDVTELMRKQGFREIFAHKKEVEIMEAILARAEKNNVLIVGESGSARKSMIEALSNRCALGESLPELNYKRIVILDLPKLFAATESIEEAEEILDKIFNEAVYAGNVILVIDNIHNYIGVSTERRAGIVEISGALSSYLVLPSFRFIGITTFEGLHINIEQNSAILPLLEKVEVSEISEEETLLILKDRVLMLEGRYKIIVSWPALRDIVSLSARYLPALPFPEKAMGLLDEVMVYAAKGKKKIVLPEDIAKIITGKTQIPVGELKSREKDLLLNLENLIHQRIINQGEAVGDISAAMRRARSEVTIRSGPIGCFLFLGPTGVGKTETSKALSEIYFGSEEKMIRLDMSEFQVIKDISRLIGSAGERGLLTTPVRENPFSLILLDEFEKAHPNILNLFLQVLDEGHLTDGLGRKVSFLDTIIIATSNAGYQIILEALKEKTDWPQVKQKLLDFIFEKGIFRPELINRFDGVIVFRPLSKENLLDIAELLLQKLKKNIEEKGIELIITEPLKEKMVELGYNPVFGAREMRRVIQDKVENVLATSVLSGKIKRGNKIQIDPVKFEVIIIK